MEGLLVIEDSRDKCLLCNEGFNWKTKYVTKGELSLCELVTSHKKCENLLKKKQKLQDALMEVEYQIWNKKYFY
jgi:hypothetical protein